MEKIAVSRGRILIGLDVGGSITKIVGLGKGIQLREARVQANDPIASAYGALGKFLTLNDLRIDQIESIHATGVGASYLDGRLMECETVLVPEFDAVGLGGLYAACLDRAIVVSMGTGTSIVYADRSEIRHIIGSGVGGGTLLGLAQVILNVRDFDSVGELADKGDLRRIDLTVGDISRYEIPGLSNDTTASNFGKVGDQATPNDLAMGIVNLVFQSVGTDAVLAAKLEKVEKIVFTGNLLHLDKGRHVLADFSQLYSVDILIPERAEYATALGAALYKAH
ncbi:MAG TPA: type II pantothenate kinase [Bacillota bacterium]|nr:type II pantothenate kinase [Fastidiosipila sp.]HPX92860.1 type II pantothenate kinase [Bacillota bacterium]HQB80750.1 type II pantothenate kinase [Bacillota bacterium]